MKKTFILLMIPFLLFSLGFSNPIDENKRSESNTTTDTDMNALNKLGYDTVLQMLNQQEENFESGRVMENSSLSKLTETDEAVLLYTAMVEIDKLQLLDFHFSIEELSVDLDKDGVMLIKAYITRNFVFQGDEESFETGLGDDITLKIKEDTNNVINSEKTDLENVAVMDSSANKSEITSIEDFVSKYKEEVAKDNSYSINSSEEEVIVDNELSYNYLGSAAAYYALKYALTPNKSYKYYNGADCTNFVSQALRYGGIPHFKEWKPYTNAWINAGSFRNYIREPGGILMKTVQDKYANAKLGDVYHYDTRNKVFLPIPDGWMEHTAIVTSLQNKKILVSYHSNNRKNVPREYYTSVEGGKRYLSSIR